MSRTLWIGIFVVAGLLVLAAGVFLIGSKELMFSSTYTLRSEFENVSGLIEGAQVRVGGVQEGTIDRIELPKSPDRKVAIVMDMKRSTHDLLKKDSVASIKTEGLLGDKYVEISFGSSGAE